MDPNEPKMDQSEPHMNHKHPKMNPNGHQTTRKTANRMPNGSKISENVCNLQGARAIPKPQCNVTVQTQWKHSFSHTKKIIPLWSRLNLSPFTFHNHTFSPFHPARDTFYVFTSPPSGASLASAWPQGQPWPCPARVSQKKMEM